VADRLCRLAADAADEAWVTADYKAEMIEHIERFPRVRDRSLFVGNPDNIVCDGFGPGLPTIRGWTEAHYAFPGYIQHFDRHSLRADRDALRAQLGFGTDERVVVDSVGGTAVVRAWLQRII
jgi:hypothetical protein